jgi:putative peptidoglycan lipid II flippase
MEKQGRRATWELFARILNLAFIVTGLIALLIILFAEPLVTHIIAPGFPAEQKALTVEIMRLDLLAIMVFSVSGLVMAGLQANQHFVLPAIAPALYNIGQIFGVLVLARTFNHGIYGLVYGVILGACLHLGIQVPALIKYEFRWLPRIDLRHPGVRQTLGLLLPRVVTMFFIQIFFVARDNIASGLGEGAVSALNYGWFIMQVPETIIGSALSIALLPTLAEFFARGETEAFKSTVNKAIRVILGLTIPAAAVLAAGVEPVLTILDFDAAGAQMVALAARVYLMGMTGHALLEVASRSFYARQNALIPLLAAALNAGMYILFAVNFSRLLGVAGIALANSLAFTFEASLLLYLLNSKIPGVLQIGKLLPRVLAVATLVGAGVYGAVQYISLPLPEYIFGALVMGVGGLVLLPFILPELRVLVRLGKEER